MLTVDRQTEYQFAAMKFETEAGSALFALIGSLCYHPNDMKVEERVSGSRVELVFRPHMADIPILVGRDGRQIKAIQFLAAAIGKRSHQVTTLEVEESYIGHSVRREFVPNPGFSVEPLLDILMHVCGALFGRLPQYAVINTTEKVTIGLDLPAEETGSVMALADAFYPYGFRHGRRVRIRNMNYRATLDYAPARRT